MATVVRINVQRKKVLKKQRNNFLKVEGSFSRKLIAFQSRGKANPLIG